MIEAGRKSDIRFSTLAKLAKACGLEPAELLDFKTAPVGLAEGKAEHGFQRALAKAARKAPKRQA